MPYVNIQVVEGITTEQKAELIAGAADLLQRVLNKDPAVTYVVIDEVPAENWGVKGLSLAELNRRRGEAG